MKEPKRRHSAKRRVTAALASGALGLGALAVTAPLASATSNLTTSRLGGLDRYQTAADIAEAAFPSGASTAIVATGENYPDALAANYLAGDLNAPVLLTSTDSLNASTSEALAHLGVSNVDIVGGTAAVSAAVATAIAALPAPGGGKITVTRIAGNTRYGTAADIATTPPTSFVGDYNSVPTAIVTTGLNFPDALSVGPMAYAKHFPVLLTDPSTLSPETAAALTSLHIQEVLVPGGDQAVSSGVISAIEALNPTIVVDQFAPGTDRYETSADVASFEVNNLGFSASSVLLARGDEFPDALAGGPLGGVNTEPIVLTSPSSLPQATSNFLAGEASSLTSITALGGTSAISDSTLAAAAAAAGQTTPTPTPTQPPAEAAVVHTEGPDLVSATLVVQPSSTSGTLSPSGTFTPEGIEACFDQPVTINPTVADGGIFPSSFDAADYDVNTPAFSSQVVPVSGSPNCILADNFTVDTGPFTGSPDNDLAHAHTLYIDSGSVTGDTNIPNIDSTTVINSGSGAPVAPVNNVGEVVGPNLLNVTPNNSFSTVTYNFDRPLYFTSTPDPANFCEYDASGNSVCGTAIAPITSGTSTSITVSFAPAPIQYTRFVVFNGPTDPGSRFTDIYGNTGLPVNSVGSSTNAPAMVSGQVVSTSPFEVAVTFNQNVLADSTDYDSCYAVTDNGATFEATSAIGTGNDVIDYVFGSIPSVTNIYQHLVDVSCYPDEADAVISGAQNEDAIPGSVAIASPSDGLYTGPNLESATYDSATGVVTLTFDESVAASSIKVSDIGLIESNDTINYNGTLDGVAGKTVTLQFPSGEVASAAGVLVDYDAVADALGNITGGAAVGGGPAA
jgi:putative cell wall-binding protein